MTYENPHDDPAYQQFVEECAKVCQCCEECGHSRPCDGVLAGGPCDHACTCDSDMQRTLLEEQRDPDAYREGE